jgi:SAM-dependent methyltransferase
MKRFRDTYLGPQKHLRILDVGSADVNGTYADLFDNPNWTYRGADMVEGKNVHVILVDPYDWRNIESNSFDVVISGQTFEHIEYFWITILQIARIMKVGGLACIIAPSSGPQHRHPTDCWRYYPDGLRAIAKWAKMEVLETSTEWEAGNYDDSSASWKDSMLVAMKVATIPQLSSTVQSLHEWIGIKGKPEFEIVQDILETQIGIVDEYTEAALRKLLRNPPHYPDWYLAIVALMQLYIHRPDLQIAFPKVSLQCDLTDLVNWAAEFGVKEQSELAKYSQLFKGYTHT